MIFKSLTEKIYDWFDNHREVGTVTFGDESEVDISNETMFPLVHISPGSITNPSEGFTQFNYDIYILTQKDDTYDAVDALDITSDIAIEFKASADHGPLFDNYIRISGSDVGSIVYDKFGNRLYGYSIAYSLIVPNFKC